MNSVEKDSLLQQAICCAGNYAKKVADMLLAGNKCAESEFNKLVLLAKSIEVLDCYNAPLEVEECVVDDLTGDLTCTTTTTEYTNCLTDTEADNLVNMITKICDTCNCD